MTFVKLIESHFLTRANKNALNYPLYEVAKSLYRYLNFLKKYLQIKVLSRNYDPIEMFNSKGLNLSYIVNSKVACSSIKKSLMQRDNIIVNDDMYNDIHKLAKENGYHNGFNEENTTFTVVRNPYERIVSLYINKFVDHRKITKIGFEYENYLGGIFKQHDSFYDFVRKLSMIPDDFSDRHFKSQCFLIDESKIDNVKVFKLEKIDDLNQFFARFDIGDLGHANKSSKYNYKEYYSIDTFNMISERFAEDIERLDYQCVKNELKEYLLERERLKNRN